MCTRNVENGGIDLRQKQRETSNLLDISLIEGFDALIESDLQTLLPILLEPI